MIYLDSAATSKPNKDIIKKIVPYMTILYSNPSSSYKIAEFTRTQIDKARDNVMKYLGAKNGKVIFTCSSSASNNLAIQGITAYNRFTIACSPLEHVDILDCIESLSYNKHCISVNREGQVNILKLEEEIKKFKYRPFIVVQMANNETGTVNNIKELSRIAHKYNGICMTDATQAVTKIDINVDDLEVDILSFGGHKIGGIRGASALYLSERVCNMKIKPLIYGHQEDGLFSGTENTPAIIALSEALKLKHNNDYIREIRDYFESKVLDIPNTYINGNLDSRVPNITNVCFRGCEANTIQDLLGKDRIYISTGSACNSDSIEPSHVLKAMGIPEPDIYGCCRFSFSEDNTKEEIDEVIERLTMYIDMLRSFSSEEN